MGPKKLWYEKIEGHKYVESKKNLKKQIWSKTLLATIVTRTNVVRTNVPMTAVSCSRLSHKSIFEVWVGSYEEKLKYRT